MKKRMLSFLLAMTLVLSIMSVSVPTAAALSASEITAKMNQLKNTYPSDTYWNHAAGSSYNGYSVTSTPCNTNGYTCNQLYGGSQCYAFARHIAYLLFGSYPQNVSAFSDGYVDANGWTCIRDASKVTLEPGDYIRADNHSAIVWYVDGDLVYVAQCWGSSNCKLNWGAFWGSSKCATLSAIVSTNFVGVWKHPGSVHTHTWGSWTTSKAATCTETGTETRTCSGCGESENRTLAALGHNYTSGACTRCGAEDPDFWPLSGTCGEHLTWTLDQDGLLTIAGTGAMYDYDDDNPKPWSDYASHIQSVVVEEGVTSVGNRSFTLYHNLSAVTLSSTVEKIGDYAFYMSSLSGSLKLPASVKTIGKYAFGYCANITSVVIPASVTSIHYSAFSSCPNLNWISVSEENETYSSSNGVLFNKAKTELVRYPAGKTDLSYEVPSSVRVLGAACFGDAKVETVKLPDNLDYVYSMAFDGCGELKSIAIPSGTRLIYNAAFRDCEKLEKIVLPSTLTKVYDGAFSNCASLQKVIYVGTEAQWNAITVLEQNDDLLNADKEFVQVMSGVCSLDGMAWSLDLRTGLLTVSGTGNIFDYSIGQYFDNLYSWVTPYITSLVIEEGVERIGDYAFCQMRNLRTIHLPATVTSVGEMNFYYQTTGLTDVYYAGTEAQWQQIAIEDTNHDLLSAALHCLQCAHADLSCTPAKAATCTETGNQAYWTCSGCEKLFADAAAAQETTLSAVTLAALGHNYANGTCSRCGAADPDYSAGSAVVGAESVTVHPGDTFSIPVVIRNNPGFAGFSFGAVYDSNALTLTAIDQGSLMTNTMVFYGSPENGEVVWAGTKNVTGDGDLYILTFTVSEDAAEGEYSIQTVLKGNDTGNFTNDSYEPVPVTFQSGTVKVTKLVYGDLNGDTKVNVTDLVRFARSLVSMETLTDTQRQAADVNLDGKTNVTDAVIIARYLVGSVKELPYQPAAATAFRMSSAPRNTSVSISADTVQANAGDTVTVPVNISNNTGIAGFNLKFTYDTDALTLTAINGGSLLANTMVFMGSTENSEVVWAGTQNITGDGELVKLTFTVNEQAKNGKYPISISLKNDDPGSLTDESYEPVPATFAPGAIQVGEHTHVWSGWHTVTDTTCTEAGLEIRSCTECDEEESRTVAAKGHKTEVRNAKEATCTEDGYTGDTECTVCGETIERGAVIMAPGHKTEVRNAREATCTEDGYTGDTVCTVCDITVEQGTVTKASGHRTEVRNAKEAACTEDGYTGDTVCTVCSETIERGAVITAPGHKTEVRNAKEATCTEDGYTGDTVCTVCSETIEKGAVIKASGHKTEVHNAKEATCTENGYTGDTVCTACSETIEQGTVITAPGHKTEVRNAKEATCTEDGYTGDTVCTVCSITVEQGAVTKAPGHRTEIRNAKEATCTEDGYTGDTVCKACGITMEQGKTVPSKGHKTEVRNAKEATCTENGYSGDMVCTVCGETLERGTVISATGHNWGAWIVTKEPTDFENGEQERSCTRCGATEREVLPALKHTHALTFIPSQSADCTMSGHIAYWICERCGGIYADSEGTRQLTESDIKLPALGHDWEEHVHFKAPTLFKPGYTGDTVCSRCGEIKEKGRVIPPLGISTVPSPDKPSAPMNFTDVKTGDWFYGDVKYVYENGLMNGASETRFDPNGTLTRAMMVTILYRMEGEPAVRFNGQFTDAPDYQWYTGAVEWAAKKGIVTGYDDGRFGPNDPVTREQLAAILYRYAQYKGNAMTAGGSLSAYKDGSTVSAYANEAVRWAVAEGLLNGSDGRLLPRAQASRAQVAAIIRRFLEK